MDGCTAITEITTSSLDRETGVLTIINASPSRHEQHNIKSLLLSSPKIEPLHLKNTSSENDNNTSNSIDNHSEEACNKSDSGNPQIILTENDDEFSPVNDCLPLSPEEVKDIQYNLQHKSGGSSIMIEEIEEREEICESSEIMGNTDFKKKRLERNF